MDPLVQQLKQRADDLDVTGLEPQASLGAVVRRGRRYLLLTHLLTVAMTGTAVAAGAVVVPELVDRPPAPVVVTDALPTPVPTATATEPATERPTAPRLGATLDPIPDPTTDPETESELEPDPQPTTPPKPEQKAEPTTTTPKPEPKPEPEPKPTADPELYLTANQKHSTVEGEPPTNLYWGTATPGKKVKVYSDFGWASTTAAADGSWKLSVVFDGAPSGEHTFQVVAKLWDHPEHHRVFELTTIRGDVVAFTATQHHDTVPASEPRGRWSGTAQPGSRVWIWSEYGQAEVSVDADGNWEASVLFSGAPTDTPFDVKAKSLATGEAIWFTMTVTS